MPIFDDTRAILNNNTKGDSNPVDIMEKLFHESGLKSYAMGISPMTLKQQVD